MPQDYIKGLPKLRAWRTASGLSQEALAERAGLTVGSISQLEGEVMRYSQNSLEGIADALGCTPAEVLMGPPAEDSFWPLFQELEKLEGKDRERAYRMIKAILGDDD